jgi:O-antigen/teichoic acid export membrane protein
MFISLIVSLFTTRIVFNNLGFENYGIYNIVGSIIVLFTFINNGLQGATRRYILAELATGNILSQRKIFTLSIKSHVLISLIIFIIGESIGLYILNYILNIPQERMFAANVVYQLSIFTCIISIMQSPYQSAIIAYEKMSIYAYLSIFDVIAKLVIMYFVYVINFDKLIIYGISIFGVTTLIFLIHLFYCKYTFPMCKYIKTNDNKELKSMYSYMGWALFGQASNIASQQGAAYSLTESDTIPRNSTIP